MQTDTGHIFTVEEMEAIRKATLSPKELARYKTMRLPPTQKQMARIPPRVGKYDLCPCGSGKKFKWCCYTGAKQCTSHS